MLRGERCLSVGNDLVYVKQDRLDPLSFFFPNPGERQKREIADFAEKRDAHRQASGTGLASPKTT